MRAYRGASGGEPLPPVGPYSSPMPRDLWWSLGVGSVSYARGNPVGQLSAALPKALARRIECEVIIVIYINTARDGERCLSEATLHC